ncbi:Hypothetical protein CINCED_3A013994, partial [Cinara cedri]
AGEEVDDSGGRVKVRHVTPGYPAHGIGTGTGRPCIIAGVAQALPQPDDGEKRGLGKICVGYAADTAGGRVTLIQLKIINTDTINISNNLFTNIDRKLMWRVGKTICNKDSIEITLNSTYVKYDYYRKSGKSNVHEATKNCQRRTKNNHQGWNNRFTHLVGHAHPTVWKSIIKTRKDLGAVRAKIALQELGKTIPVSKRRKFGNIGERLKNLCSSVVDGEISMDAFLISIA